jgi:hypothetical protein
VSHVPDGPLGEAGARLRAIVATLRADAAQVLFEVHPEVYPGAVSKRLTEAADAIDALLSAPVGSPPQEDQELELAPIIPGRNPRSWTMTEAAPVVSPPHPQRVITTDTVTGVQRERLIQEDKPCP